MTRILNIFFFGLAILFFTVLAITMYRSLRYVNENQPYVRYQQKIAAEEAEQATTERSPFNTSETEIPEIDFAAIDSLLNDDDELDSLLQLTDEPSPPADTSTTLRTNVKPEPEIAVASVPPVAAPAVPKKQARPATVAPRPSSVRNNYFIAVGAFKDNANAKYVYNRLKKQGHKNVKRIKNNTFTLIRMDGYASKSLAEVDLTKVRKEFKEAYIRKK
ncbi:MAG: SPOR domain-containing protein [Bacteroidota bacterium]